MHFYHCSHTGAKYGIDAPHLVTHTSHEVSMIRVGRVSSRKFMRVGTHIILTFEIK